MVYGLVNLFIKEGLIEAKANILGTTSSWGPREGIIGKTHIGTNKGHGYPYPSFFWDQSFLAGERTCLGKYLY